VDKQGDWISNICHRMHENMYTRNLISKPLQTK
jgi:hypothetical protein